MLNACRFAAALLKREWRKGEWTLLWLALLVAVAATTSMHFYIDRLMRGLDQQNAKILGGDLAISSAAPLPLAFANKARALNMQTAEIWSYPSVISTKDKMQLVNVQAVSADYVQMNPNIATLKRGSVWVEPRLLKALSLGLGGNITLGVTDMRVSQLLTFERDHLSTGWQIAPRIMIRMEDVPATRTVLTGSRVDYRLLIIGNEAERERFRQWLLPQLKTGQQLLDARNQQSILYQVIERTQHYLHLILLVCLTLSGVAIMLSLRQYLRRHEDNVALYRCLGARQRQISAVFIWEFFFAACIAGMTGIFAGFIVQAVFAHLFSDVLQFPLPHASLRPVWLGFIVSVSLLFSFAYPIINTLPRVPPLHLWRHELHVNSFNGKFYPAISLLLLLAFIYWFMDFSLFTLYYLDLIVLASAFLYGFSFFLLAFFRLLLPYLEGPLRQGVNQLLHHGDSVSLQFVGFTLIMMAILTLGWLRTDLIRDWQKSLPPQTPNYFAFNIDPESVNDLQHFFAVHHVPIEGIYPMVRGRLIALNKQPIFSVVPKEAQQHNALHRELNLSWMWQLPSDNKIVSGRPWMPQDKNKAFISVENQLANDLKLKLGDELTFQIGAKQFSGTIINFRRVNWSSFHPNFFMIFPPQLLAAFPATDITSFHLGNTKTGFLNELVQRFPSITVIDVAGLLQQMQLLISKVSLSMQILFLFALAAGVLIFLISLQVSMDERKQTYHLLRVLGASRRYIRRVIWAEFICLAIMIAGAAFFLAYVIVYLLEKKFFLT